MHTPGHARGHLCFHDERTGVLITGDNIVGVGSVLIDPPQGNMREYLDSLERMRSLPNLTVLFGGHGPAVATPYKKIDEYISHRLEREQKILDAVRAGAVDAERDRRSRLHRRLSQSARDGRTRRISASRKTPRRRLGCTTKSAATKILLCYFVSLCGINLSPCG